MTARTDGGPPFRGSTPTGGPKDVWRTRLLAARRAMSSEDRAAAADALTRHALALAGGTGGPVAAYLPVGAEPWSVAGLDALVAAGHEVLLPVARGPEPLDWAAYRGELVPAPFGLREPPGERLGAAAVSGARLVLVPGLGADRTGTRLGRGAGHYDRSLPLVAPGTPIVIVLYDDELVEHLPAEPHDVPMTAVLRPETGVTPLATPPGDTTG